MVSRERIISRVTESEISYNEETMKHRYELEFWVIIEEHLSIRERMMGWFRRWSLRVNDHGVTRKLAG